MTVNGTKRSLDAPQTLQSFLELEGFDASRVVVEQNGSIVPRSAFKSTLLQDSDTIEVVALVGGG